jgi:ubiquinone/menaquinone biosynthesis C-methylase UbiE
MKEPLYTKDDSYLKLSDKTRKRYNRIAPMYDFMEWITEKSAFQKWRRLLWSQVQSGKVLEVGVGTGKNIPYYPPKSEVTAIDISDNMMSIAKKRASEISKSVDFQMMDVQSLSFPDNYFDSAVATFVFCSVPIPISGLKELKRVVKPDGDIWLLEHVRINKPIIGNVMDLLNPIIVRMMGANINRNTEENVKASGLNILEVVHLQGELVKLIHSSA